MAGLGRRGLDVLLQHNTSTSSNSQSDTSDGLRNIDISCLLRGKFQPRAEIDPDSVTELAESIKSQGIIQPIAVRSLENGQYEILAGERRWQAAKVAGLSQVPCIVKNVSDRDAMLIALIENLQRENLNPIEEAQGLEKLKKNLSCTDEELAKTVGKSRSGVTNILRLNDLTEKVKSFLINGDLTAGHAKALLAISDPEKQESAAITVIQKEMSVRKTEDFVKSIISPKKEKAPKEDPVFDSFQETVSKKLAEYNVKCVSSGKNRGRLILSYSNIDELQKIKDLLEL